MIQRIALPILACLLLPSALLAGIVPGELRCEYTVDPLGIQTPKPRLSWVLRSEEPDQTQTAYRIVAASSRENLAAGKYDLWDSGRVASAESVGVVWGGEPLASRRCVWWTVFAWDRDAKMTQAEKPACFEVGLLQPNDWEAQWIRGPEPLPKTDAEFYGDHPAPLFRKGFALPSKVKKARLYVSGLGYYHLTLNGNTVGDRRLDPGWTTYSKRVLYSTYDVTGMLAEGENCLGAVVGNGWYNPLPLRMWGAIEIRKHLTVGPPRLICQLEIECEDGSLKTVATDPSWRTADSAILKNSVYLGEVVDARREIPGWNLPGFDDSSWKKSIPAKIVLGPLQAQAAPPIRVTQTLRPEAITEPKPGVFLVDFGRNFAGWVRVRAQGNAGTRIVLTHGELVHEDGTLNARTAAAGQIKAVPGKGGPGAPTDAFRRDEYILKGDGDETFEPLFGFHGFRYVQVEGYPGRPAADDFLGMRACSDLAKAGEFSCSNPLFNRIQTMFEWTLLSNVFSVQSDCPSREKFGYGGDIVATDEAVMYNFDMATFYAKVVRDFEDAARPGGGLTETAPYVGIDIPGLGEGVGPVGWGTVHPLLLRGLYRRYGEKRLIEEQYETSRQWVMLLESKAQDGILDNGIGDHESLVEKDIPLSGTAFYYLNVRLLEELAGILDRPKEARRYRELAGSIEEAFNATFLDRSTGKYLSGTQANQAFALEYGLVPPLFRAAALGVLVENVMDEHKGHLSTGIFGTRYMLDALSEMGRAEVAHTIANQKTFPGWGHMVENGATTLWEHWEYSDDVFSHNHPMFGSVSEWFFKHLAGIRPADDAVGFDKAVIQPKFVSDLEWVKAHHDTIRGRISSEWKRDGETIVLRVGIPVGMTAKVILPAKCQTQIPAATFSTGDAGQAVYAVGSGETEFAFRGKTN